MRHPMERGIPPLWQKLDPVLGSTLVFFLPCFVLAILPPYMIRLAARQLEHVGTISGLIYSASTVGSIAGVFVSGYALIDYMDVPDIFRATGVLTLALAGLSLVMDRGLMTRERLNPK
jgi:predicted MFS family arabinose efflux permease